MSFVPAGVKKREEGGVGLVGTELVSVYISVCAALAATGGTTKKLVKWSPTHLKPYPLQAPATEPHPPEALST